MHRLRSALTVLTLLTFSQTAHAQNSKRLDNFLGSLDKFCFTGQGFGKFVRSVAQQIRVEEPKLPLVLALPADLAGRFEQKILVTGTEFYRITFPAKGLTYAGLSVSSIDFDLGVESGVMTFTVMFNAPVSAVRKMFDPARIKLEALRKNSDLVTTIAIGGVDGKSGLSCDMST